MLAQLFRQPLVHFLLLGGALFLAIQYLESRQSPPASPDSITIDRAHLLSFLQYRRQNYSPEHAERELETLSTREYESLLEDLIRNEVLYREALKLGLDQGDYLIRQHLVRKMESLIAAVEDSGQSPTQPAVERYYLDHQTNYRIPPRITFTHVFFSSERRGLPEAIQAAVRQMETLDHQKVAFSQAMAYGDHFPYQRNYVQRSREFVAGELGNTIADHLFSDTVILNRWQGPVLSPHGAHLVLVTEKIPPEVPALASIRSRVERDFVREQARQRKQTAIQQLIGTYRIHLLDTASRRFPGPTESSRP